MCWVSLVVKYIINSILHDHSCEIFYFVLQHNLKGYIEQILHCITNSGLMCPTSMCEIFFALKEAAENNFPGKTYRFSVR